MRNVLFKMDEGINWIPQNVNVIKDKKRLWKSSRLHYTVNTWQLPAVNDTGCVLCMLQRKTLGQSVNYSTHRGLDYSEL